MYKKINRTITQEVEEYAFLNAIPLFTTVEVSQECNLSCRHCYNFDRRNKHTTYNFITLEEQLKALDDLIALGAFYIAFTGGEPLLYKGLFTLIDRVIEQHCIVRIKSNGLLLNTAMIQRLIEHGVYSLDISLYGSNDQEYRDFTGYGVYAQVIEGIKQAKKAGINITLNILLHKGNYRSIDKMIALAKELKLSFNITDEITARYDGSGVDGSWRLEEAELEWLYQSEYKSYFAYDNSSRSVQCSCARTVCALSATGDIYPCIGAPIRAGNIRNSSIAKIWHGSTQLNKIRLLKREDFIKCSKCQFIEKCSRSSGSVYVNTGNYTGCDPYTHLTAQLRARYL